MPIEILMPALSPTMSEGTLARWLKNEGDTVKSGDVIAEIETDKATMEFEAVDEGTIGKILIPGGTAGVKVNQPIAILLEEGEDSSSIVAKPAAAAAAPAAAPAAAAAPKAAPAPAAANPFEPAYEEIPNSTMRKVIAKRLTEAKQTVPHFYLTIDCEVDALLKVRSELNSRSDAYKLSVNDFVIRAVALALKKVPAANASWGEEAIKRYKDVDVSVAVATPQGLITPIIHHADHKGLSTISNEMKELAVKAKDGKLKPEEFQGGGFTISNLGMFGVKEFAAIINPPQGCILAVGAGEQRPVVKNGALAIATVMSCTLSVDHRVVDGAVGAEFLAAFKKLIEDPLSMLL